MPRVNARKTTTSRPDVTRWAGRGHAESAALIGCGLGEAARGRGEMEHSGCPAVTPTLRDLDQPNDSSYVRELALRGRQAVSVDHWV